MIETIFYFANSKAEYDSNVNSGNISARTISFVPTGDGETGDIYKNGIKYGSSIDGDEILNIINNVIEGGDFDISNAISSSVSVSSLLDSGTPIADITVGNSTTRLFAPAGSGSGGGSGSGSEPYDDTDIKNAIKDLQDRADATESDLRDLLDETEEEVREKFKNAFDTYEDLINYYKQSGDTTPTQFTFGKEDADEWASQMGLITPNGDGTYNVGWSTLTQSYNSLAGEVALIKANQSAGGEIDYEALSAGLYSYIDENAATSGMDSTWGKFVKKDDDEIQMLEWMESAIKTYASNEEAYARLLAAAKDYDENGNAIQEGIAKINAFVEKDSNGNYVAGTSLASMIDDGVNTSLSEVFTENSSNSAVAGLYARLSDAESRADDAYNNASDNYDAISGLQNKVEEIDGEYIAKADLVTALKNKKDEIMSASGLGISASINAATSNLSSQIEGTYAKISTTVTKDPDTKKIESEVRLNADQIYLDGTTWAELINAEQIVANQLSSQNIKTSELEVFGNGTKLSINGTNGILLEGQNSNPYHFDIDGSGQFASGAISWDTSGNISFGSKFISAANANLSVDSLVATKTGAGTTTVDGNGFFIEGVQAESAIRSDGSGYLADGAISWDTAGNTTIRGTLNGATGTFSGALSAATGTFSGAINILKSGVDKVIINSNDTSTSSTQDITIIDNSGFYVKRGSQGFRLTSSNGLERYNGSNFEPFYANHKARMGLGTLYADDDFVLTTGNCTLPSSVQNGKVISILNIGGSRVNVLKGSSSYIKSGTNTFNSYADLNPGDKLEFVFYNNVWYSTFSGTTTDGE